MTLRITGFLGFVCPPVFWKIENTMLWKLVLFPSAGEEGGGGSH
jgi:hypothetical protein